MSLRTLYLKTAPSYDDRNRLAGRNLQEQFREHSSVCLSGYRVLSAEASRELPAELSGEAIPEESLKDLAPNVIYMEGGLFADNCGRWKIRWTVVESVVERGGVLIVADCGTGELLLHRPLYNHAARFLRARAEISTGAISSGAECTLPSEPDKPIVCVVEGMTVTEWLRPALSGISEIAVRNPARLVNWEQIAASGNVGGLSRVSSGNQKQVPGEELGIFASVAQCGFGFVAFIAGEVSADSLVEQFPSNARWLTNLSGLLLENAERNRARAALPDALPFAFFLSHRSVNKQLAIRVGEALRNLGTQVSFEGEYSVPVDPRPEETNRALEPMTHFVLFWSRACLGAPWVERKLPTALSMAVERRLPVLVVRLDMAPVPQVIADAFRIEGLGKSPQEIAESLIRAARRLERNRS
ncbi:MAG TPA: toll/interleukin-1 receptor domain-containing protein [Patescibacteria group bacterium]|nr:toll/interleukin-1 receptor domain-containing protein [Patescibacteria group bacterium]